MARSKGGHSSPSKSSTMRNPPFRLRQVGDWKLQELRIVQSVDVAAVGARANRRQRLQHLRQVLLHGRIVRAPAVAIGFEVPQPNERKAAVVVQVRIADA